jgi:hypothetical protein
MVITVSTPAIVSDRYLRANAANFSRHLRAATLSPATQRTFSAQDVPTWRPCAQGTSRHSSLTNPPQ